MSKVKVIAEPCTLMGFSPLHSRNDDVFIASNDKDLNEILVQFHKVKKKKKVFQILTKYKNIKYGIV